MDDILKRITGFVHTFDAGSLPAEVNLCARRAFADTVACMALGSRSPQVSATARAIGVSLSGGAFAGVGNVSLLDAALLDGVAAHSNEYNDLFFGMPGHPSAVIVPVALALGDNLALNGRAVLEGYAAGFEVLSRVNSALLPLHHEKGFHSTSAAGILGAAVCAAKLLGFDAEQIAQTLCLACTFACGLRRNFGSSSNSLHVGNAAQGGLRAALLVREGITADPDMLTASDGYINAFYGSVDRLAALCSDLGERWAFLEPGLLIKKYPACFSTYQAIDATLALVREHDFDAGDISRVSCRTCELNHNSLPSLWAHDAYSRRFCIPYCIAAALCFKRIVPECFDDEHGSDGRLEALRPLITCGVADELKGLPGYGFTEIKLTTLSGEVFSARAYPREDEKVERWSDAALKRKFIECCRSSLGETRAGEAYEMLMSLEGLGSIRDVTRSAFATKG